MNIADFFSTSHTPESERVGKVMREDVAQPVTLYLSEALAAKMGILCMDYEQACRHITEKFSIPLDLSAQPAWTILRPVPQNLPDDPGSFVGTTCAPTTQEPLTFERMQRLVQELRDQYPDPPVEILSPAEYFRRTSYRLPLSEETLAALEPPSSFSFPFMREVLYEFALQHHMNIADFCRAYRPFDITLMIEAEHATKDLNKARQALERLAARARRQHRAWLRKKRQRRAQQRRHRRGLA